MRSQGRKSIQRSPETKGKQPFLFDVGELVDIAIALNFLDFVHGIIILANNTENYEISFSPSFSIDQVVLPAHRKVLNLRRLFLLFLARHLK